MRGKCPTCKHTCLMSFNKKAGFWSSHDVTGILYQKSPQRPNSTSFLYSKDEINLKSAKEEKKNMSSSKVYQGARKE